MQFLQEDLYWLFQVKIEHLENIIFRNMYYECLTNLR